MSLTADTTLVLPASAPFEFSKSLAFLDGFAPGAEGRVCRESELVVGGFAPEPFVAHVAPDGPDAIRAHVDWPNGAGDGRAVADHLDAHLSLSDDLTPMYEAAREDESFAAVVARLFGYHHVRFPTPFEAACWAALSQRTPLSAAAGARDALARAVGRVVAVDGRELSLFPTPAMVRGRPAAVREAIGHERTSETVLAAAEAFLDADLTELDAAALRDRLEDVPGFGPWSAEFVALRGFGRTSVLPTEEDRLRTAVGDAYGLDDPTMDDASRLAEPYGEYRGYWAHYLRVWESFGGD